MKLKWNAFYQIFFASQIDLFASALITLKHWEWRGESGDKVASVCSLITLGYLLMATVYMVYIIYGIRKRDLFDH